MQEPTIGRMVHVLVDPRRNGGEEVAVGLITKVKTIEGEARVNLRIFLDTGSDIRRSFVKVLDSRPEGETSDGNVAFWPPRV